jgi:hypothetical protein
MRSLTVLIAATLSEEEEIPELPNDTLRPLCSPGILVAKEIEIGLALKIARLQTLIFLEQEKGEIPDYATISSKGPTVMANYLAVQEDATSNIIMLERLIVGIVRDAFPKEAERFSVRYFLSAERNLLCAEAANGRYLD